MSVTRGTTRGTTRGELKTRERTSESASQREMKSSESNVRFEWPDPLKVIERDKEIKMKKDKIQVGSYFLLNFLDWKEI